jgi:hypothetical protein
MASRLDLLAALLRGFLQFAALADSREEVSPSGARSSVSSAAPAVLLRRTCTSNFVTLRTVWWTRFEIDCGLRRRSTTRPSP